METKRSVASGKSQAPKLPNLVNSPALCQSDYGATVLGRSLIENSSSASYILAARMLTNQHEETLMKFRKQITEPTASTPVPYAPVKTESDFDVAHSEKNILTWMTYLPQDCIEMMIRMGWDCST
jgi:hypothetical protein